MREPSVSRGELSVLIHFCKAGTMTYFLEYTVQAPTGEEEFAFPHDEIAPGTTVPLSQTDADTVHTPELPVRTGIIGATAAEAKLEAEQLITHSRATEATLYFDPSNSLRAGIGTRVATFKEGRGWQDA